MTNPNLTTGSIWRLHHGNQEIARLTVTGTDVPWTHAEVEALPGFEEFRPLFTEQERAVDEEDWERADACYTRIRSALTMTFPTTAARSLSSCCTSTMTAPPAGAGTTSPSTR
jgi:hypothetical protein